MSILVLVDSDLNKKTLLKLFKATIDAKNAALWDMGVINHFSFDPLDLEDNESILIASKGSAEEVNQDELYMLIKNVQTTVRKAIKESLNKCGFPKDVLAYMGDVGVGVDDLVDAGMELVVGIEKTQEIREKLKNQIYHSLDDLNVVSFIIAGIRLEEDYEKHRVCGVDVDDDPAYLYSDEVFGMSVANQIAGTKAIFNFKRYDEAKPGIISKLGPVLDDVFAGLVAGCMSKVFEV
jgi:alpha-ribazole phosphatase CobZ